VGRVALPLDDRNPTGWPQVIQETKITSLATTVSGYWVYGLQRIAGAVDTLITGSVRYYGYDALGSVRFTTDNNTGSVAIDSQFYYDAYGRLTASATVSYIAERFRYAGEEWDADLGLYYLRARYYAPEYGRFWTMDSYEGNQSDPLSLHKYLYAHGNPVNGTDPSGHMTLIETLKSVSIGVAVEAMHAAVVVSRYKAIKHALFPTQYIGKDSVSGFHQQLARLSKNVYSDTSSGVGDWQPANLAELGLQSSKFKEGPFFSRLYKNSTRNAYVLAFRGTEPGLADWPANILQSGLGLSFSTQYDQAVALAEEVNQAVGGAELCMTGHSLGGGLASAAALAANRPAVTFNSAGLNALTRITLLGSSYSSRTVNYSVDGEILTELQNNTFSPEAFGQLYRIRPAPQDAGASAISLHGMDFVLRALGIGE